MERYVIQDGATTYSRISKSDARKMFNKGESFYIIAHKMRPGFPFSLGMTIGQLRGDQQCGFDSIVDNFCYYNANCHETGTYAAFYRMAERKA